MAKQTKKPATEKHTPRDGGAKEQSS